MRHLITTLVLIVLARPPAATAAGPETMGPLAPHIDLDPQGTPWRVVEEQGRLVVENSSEAGRVTYYFVEPQERPVAVSVSVTVTGAGQELSGAGLLYALQGEGQARLYYLFILSPDGTTSVLRRDTSGVSRMIATRVPDLDPSGPVELRVEEAGGAAGFFVNAEQVGTIQAEGVGSGAVGVAAAGEGRFTFEDFQLGRAGQR